MKKILIAINRFFSAIDFCFRRFVAWLLASLYTYERAGTCKKCGLCCRSILITMEPKFLRVRFLRNFAIWWNYFFNKMRLTDCSIEAGQLIFTCEYLTAENKCGNYFWRPFFCREYPRGFNYFEVPMTLPGCGFRFRSKQKTSK